MANNIGMKIILNKVHMKTLNVLWEMELVEVEKYMIKVVMVGIG